MNLRQKFLWNLTLSFSVIILLSTSYYQYGRNTKVQKAYNKFINEEVGTDKELQNMISELEQNLNERQNTKFKYKDNPLDLTKVIMLDGIASSQSGQKGIDCRAAWSNGDGTYSAMCFYKSNRYAVTVGDSIGGGVITTITDSKVFIFKDDKELIFNFGLDKYDDN